MIPSESPSGISTKDGFDPLLSRPGPMRMNPGRNPVSLESGEVMILME